MLHNFRKTPRQLVQVACIVLVALTCIMPVHAQVTTGNVRGVVRDQTGAVVPNAKVTITDPKTNTSQSTQSTGDGEYQFNNLLVGTYQLTVEPPPGSNFSTLTLSDVRVDLNKTTDVPTVLQPGAATATVNVSAGGAELVDTTTLNLTKEFNSRQVVDLAQTSQGAGIYNLALISPNVSSSGGVGLGTGGSVGGQRPRNNNFVVDGIDNNDKTVSGPQIYISPESVAEFNLLTNQASAEFARSTGGQFITVTKSGTNDFHGSFFEFLRNRKLNALDTLQKNAGIVRNPNAGDLAYPRYDQNRYGFNIGGPLYIPRFGEGGRSTYPWSGKNKLFFFTQYEVTGLGQAASPGGLTAPTAAGFNIINSTPGLSATNLAIFNQFVPIAPVNDAGTITVAGRTIPVGTVTFPAPNFQNTRNFVVNLDFTQSSKTQHRTRFILNRFREIDIAASLPAFFNPQPTDGKLFSYTLIHNFTSRLTNETRLAFRRFTQFFPVPNISFPGLDQFPNIGLLDLGGLDIGPDPNAPQFTIENNYQFVDQATYVFGKHALKFGGDFRINISPQSFVQRQRGDYQYTSTDLFLRDITPDFLGERTVGSSPYYGNQHILYAFAQDDWRIRPNLTLNLGVNYVYQQLPFTARLQGINAIASVPGLITFREPKAQKWNFAPRFGFAYAPNFTSGWLHRLFGSQDKSSIRGSFAMAYDTIVDNLYILSLPPQFNQTIDVDARDAGVTPNFLARGGIGPNVIPGATTDPAAARAATSSFIPDQQVPYSLSWGLSIQREFHKNYSLELRYLSSRGIHLPTQNRLNKQPKVFNGPGGFLPTFLSAPSQATVDALPVSLFDIQARSNFVPAYANAGFNVVNLIGFLANGNSTYHSGAVSLTRRFTNGFQLSAAYTLSHLIDDTTAEVFSTVLSPRRVQDFQNLRPERSDSALDRRHRFVLSSLYDLPFFRNSQNRFARTLLGGISFAGTLTFESGEKATVLSGADANLNGDTAPDRTIINLGGTPGTGSTVVPLLKTCTSFNPNGTCAISSSRRTVGYLAVNPNAQYIQAARGALATAGRNTLQLPGIRNLDFSVFKNFRLGEGSKLIQFRADFFNAFNHPQYVPGSVDGVEPISTTGVADVNTVGRTNFNIPSHVFSSHPRVIQLGLRFNF